MFLIALALAASEPPRPMAAEVVWDPITDAPSASATLRDGDGNRLVVSCRWSERARVTLHARRWFDRGNVLTGRRALTSRFDDARPQRMMWQVRARSATLGSRRRVNAFVGWLTVARRLVIRARDVEGHRFDIIFPLEGVRPAVEQALQGCRQTLERP